MPAERYVEHYGNSLERDRLSRGRGRLERQRTQTVLKRHLPPPPARILDVGGAAGVYARWLADIGYDVTLLDPVPLHLEQARAEAASGEPFMVREGDARALPEADASYDAVLLLGPLYHLVEQADRLLALGEACRVSRPGSVVAGAAINRFAPLLDGLFHGMFEQAGFAEVVEHGLTTGQHDPPPDSDFFTLAYLHRPDDLAAEFGAAGLADVTVFALEGPGWLLPDLEERYADPTVWRQVLDIAERLEQEPGFFGVSSHLLAIGRVNE